MKTQSFVDELNLYYTLNGKDCHWYYVEGDYPHISIEPIKPVEAEAISLNIEEWTGKVGTDIQLNAIVLPENAVDKTVTWSSSNSKIATVDSKGLTKAIAVGSATITATCGEASAQCEITVLDEDGVESILANPNSSISIYSVDGVIIKKDANIEDLKTLVKGFYIIVAGKDKYKISI